MLGNTSYKLFGFLEHVPTDTGFVTAVFVNNETYYIQSEGTQREITGFEKIPETYQYLIIAIPYAPLVYKSLREECIYAFKYCDDVVFMIHQTLAQYLHEQLVYGHISDSAKPVIEAFLREDNACMAELEPELVFESEGLISSQHKIIDRKPFRALEFDVDNLLNTPEPEINPKSSIELSNYRRKYLCQPLDLFSPRNVLFSRLYNELYIQQNGVKECQFKIDIRLLDINTDLPIVYDWLPWEYTRHLKKVTHLEHLREIYSRILGSGTAQSFFALLNSTPIAQLDIYQAAADDISLHYHAKPGDFGLNFLIPPQKSFVPNLNRAILTTMLDFLFTFEEVQRIVIAADESDTTLIKSFAMDTMPFKRIVSRHKTFNLYFIANQHQAG